MRKPPLAWPTPAKRVTAITIPYRRLTTLVLLFPRQPLSAFLRAYSNTRTAPFEHFPWLRFNSFFRLIGYFVSEILSS